MKYALYLPNFGAEHSARALADLAGEAEEAGWDGFFLWDHVINEAEGVPLVDVWVALTAIAMNTTRIRLGATVTPLPRRRPWKLARETVTLDHLSKGRLILGVGLGVPVEYSTFGEDSDKKIRAAKLDEGLEMFAASGKVNLSSTMARLIRSSGPLFAHQACNSHASQSGWAAGGPPRLPSGGLPAGMALFLSSCPGIICLRRGM